MREHGSILSTSNPHVKEALAIKERRSRYRHHTFLVEGPHLVDMAMASGAVIKKAFFTEDYLSQRGGMQRLRNLRERSVISFRISRQILSLLSDTETPQGIIALASYSPFALDKMPVKDIPLFVVIDRVKDPGNLGTIIRTSDAAGADAVIILPGTCDAFMPKTIRATAGSIFNIPLVYADAESVTAHLREKAIRLFVTDAHASGSIYEADLSKPLALVFGNETQGAGKTMKDRADALIRIPIFGRAESLNVALSAAVSLFEAVRQRRVHP